LKNKVDGKGDRPWLEVKSPWKRWLSPQQQIVVHVFSVVENRTAKKFNHKQSAIDD